MPHFICRWPGGDVLLASVESRQELDAILQERCEPGVCKVARYHGPLVLELTPDIPGAPCASAERFKLGPACPAFQAAWQTRLSSGDVDLLAADGSVQRAHRLVLQCRLPVLGGQPVALTTSQLRLRAVPDGSCLLSLVEFLYLDDVQQQDITHRLYMAALHCGLERLVTRCEGHFAHQLEVQLHSWPGLSEAQREGVLDSFIGWAGFAEQQGRKEMLQLCTHALALHQAAAQSRPTWESLSSRTASLVRLIAASTAPPIIHRQVLPNGTAILPVLSNPSTEGHPAAAQAAGQPPAPPASTVSVEAEAFAAAGGRMTSWEWQQLQRFRDAVAECRSVPDASPLLLSAEQLASHSLLTGEPGVNFAVKQAVLTPHRRLMDSVCRFAFPATHSLLASGWTLQPPGSNRQQPAGTGAATAAAQAAQAAASSQAGASQQQQQEAPQQQQEQQQILQGLRQRHQGLQAPAQGTIVLPSPVPVPAPRVHNLGMTHHEGQLQEPPTPVLIKRDANAAMQQCISSGSENGSTQQAYSHQGVTAAAAAVAAAAEPAQQASRAPAGSLSGLNRHVDPSWQLRAQAAAGAAALHVGSAGQVLESRPSWGSAAGTEPQTRSMPQHSRQGGLERLQSGVQSWGTGVDGAQRSPASHAGASTATGLTGDGVMQLLCQHTVATTAAAAGPAAPAVQQEASEGPEDPMETGAPAGAPLARPWGSDGASSDGTPSAEAAAAAPSTQQQLLQSPLVLQQAGPVLEGAASIAGQGFEATSSHALLPAAGQSMAAGGLIDLSLQRRLHASMGHTASRAEAMGSSAGARPAAAGAREPAAAPGQAPAALNSQQQQQMRVAASLLRGSSTGEGSVVGRCSSSSGAAAGANASLPALQRALVEDFVLYEEASAARQHVVGILVAVEQGDAAAGQRLLAPSCAELIAATAPAAVPNRLAPYLGASSVVSVAAAARAAGLPAPDVSAAVAVAAAEEYTRSTQGVGRLLGTASSSRAALEASPRQLRQQRQQQQQLLRVALQQVSNRVPWLARLLTPLQQSMGEDAGGDPTAVGTTSPGGLASTAGQEQVSPGAAGSDPPAATAVNTADAADAGQQELQSAVVELIMQLPELLHGLPGPALLTYEQFKQRYTQAQQLAAHAMQLLLPGAEGEEGNAAAAAVNGVAAELAASGLLAAASAAMAASQTAAPGDGSSGSPHQHANQPGQLFASILDSLRTPGTSPPGATAAEAAGQQQGAGVNGAEGAQGLSAAVSRGVAGAGAAAAGFLSRTAAFAAANRLADGLIRPAAANTPAASLGLSRAGSIAGPGQLGAWRLPAAGAAAAAAAGAGGGLMGPPGVAAAAAAGVLGIGMLAPTGTGALLSGGLLAEGGVAGDSMLDDMLHGNVRRITCHGLYELCAALATQPTGGVASPPAAAQQHQQQQPLQQQQQQPQQQVAEGAQGALAAASCSGDMETETSSVSTGGRAAAMGQQVAEAVATVAAAAVAVESNRRSSNHNTNSMGPPSVGLSGTKRRLSSSLDEQERPTKH